MLASVPDVDDLDRASKMLVGDIPDPLGAVAQHHFLFGPIPSPFEGFGIESAAEQFGSFDRPGIGGGSWVPNGATFWVGCGLSEDTTQFDFTGACGLSLSSAGASFQLGAYHRQLCSIHFGIQNWDGSAQNVGELQLHDAISFGLFLFDYIGPNGFGMALDSFGG